MKRYITKSKSFPKKIEKKHFYDEFIVSQSNWNLICNRNCKNQKNVLSESSSFSRKIKKSADNQSWNEKQKKQITKWNWKPQTELQEAERESSLQIRKLIRPRFWVQQPKNSFDKI
jgi:hypothetical protein